MSKPRITSVVVVMLIAAVARLNVSCVKEIDWRNADIEKIRSEVCSRQILEILLELENDLAECEQDLETCESDFKDIDSELNTQ